MVQMFARTDIQPDNYPFEEGFVLDSKCYLKWQANKISSTIFPHSFPT
jgi:hypothetical protein